MISMEGLYSICRKNWLESGKDKERFAKLCKDDLQEVAESSLVLILLLRLALILFEYWQKNELASESNENWPYPKNFVEMYRQLQ